MLFRTIYLGLTSLFLFTALAPTANANTVEAGGQAYGAGEYAKAVQIMLMPENVGDPRAQYLLGLAYRDGKGVTQSYTEAAKWWAKAGEESHIDRALFGLAEFYRDGTGVPQDHEKAFDLASKTLAYDSSVAYAFLGNAYRYGIGTPRSDVMAMEYLEKAYFKKNFTSLDTMAEMYWYGLGGPKRPEIAAHMYKRDYEENNRAASRRNLTALANAGVKYAQYADALFPKGAPDMQWISGMEALAERGNGYAQCTTGLVYFEGKRTAKDLTKARKFFAKSAEAGNLCGLYRLGSLYANGTGVAKNEDRAIGLFEMAINLSYKYAYNHPQKKDMWRENAEKALKIVQGNKETDRISARNREIDAINARNSRERAARAKAEHQDYLNRCMQNKYICRPAIGMVNYEVCEYKNVDVCAAKKRRNRR